jgi:hypothetical protein
MAKCDLCQEDASDYVILNRWAAVTGDHGTMISGPFPYRWSPRTSSCSGTVLCVRGCLSQWVEAQLVETQVRGRSA